MKVQHHEKRVLAHMVVEVIDGLTLTVTEGETETDSVHLRFRAEDESAIKVLEFDLSRDDLGRLGDELTDFVTEKGYSASLRAA